MSKRVGLDTPTISSMLPQGHFSYGAPARLASQLPPTRPFLAALKTGFTKLSFGVKMTLASLFFICCLALPASAATIAFNLTAYSPPVESIRAQEVPHTPTDFAD